MLDRLTNVAVILIFMASLAVLGMSVHDTWHSTQPWHKEWVAQPSASPPVPSERILLAMERAHAAQNFDDVSRLHQHLNDSYRASPSGTVLVRLTSSELRAIALYYFLALTLLFIPVLANYVRHGKFRVWNRGT